MSDAIRRIKDDMRRAQAEFREQAARARSVDHAHYDHHDIEMSDLTTYRLDQFEKRADAADARMVRVEELLTEIRVDLARKPTVAGLWGMVATTIGVAVAMVALFVGVLTYLQAFHPPH